MPSKLLIFVVASFMAAMACAGPYNAPGIPGYVDTDGFHGPPPGWGGDGNSRINPIFRGWATAYVDYVPSDNEWIPAHANWDDPTHALGPATGDVGNVVSLGDLDLAEIAEDKAPGFITLTFGDPNDPNHLGAISAGPGYELAVFENGLISSFTDPQQGYAAGQMLAELAYVEVSTDGVHFARFPSVSLTPAPVGPYGTTDITKVHNLAGKHPNGYGLCYGTPFDFDDLRDDPLVLAGLVDLDRIHYVRIVDIPGNGHFYDDAPRLPDPATAPDYTPYEAPHPIYDAWLTWGSGGFDLEAIGILHPQHCAGDINLNGIVDLLDFALLTHAWLGQWGLDGHYRIRADLNQDGVVDQQDLAILAAHWLCVEEWRRP